MAQLVKNPPAMWETWVQILGWEDPLEKRKATHSGILAWRIPWGYKESEMTKRLSFPSYRIVSEQQFLRQAGHFPVSLHLNEAIK